MLDSMLSASRRSNSSARRTSRLLQSILSPVATTNSARSGTHRFLLYLMVGVLWIFFAVASVGCGGQTEDTVSTIQSYCIGLSSADEMRDAVSQLADDYAAGLVGSSDLEAAADELVDCGNPSLAQSLRDLQ